MKRSIVTALLSAIGIAGAGGGPSVALAASDEPFMIGAGGRRVLTEYEPCLRTPPLFGCGGDMEMVGQWFYSYNDAPVNVVSLFDDSVVLAKEPNVSTIDRCLSLYEYVKDGRHPLFAFWDHGIVSVKTQRVKVDAGDGKTRMNLENAEIQILPVWSTTRKDGFSHPSGFESRGVPSDSFVVRPAIFEWKGAPLKDPVWVDLFTGAVYEIPAKQQIVHSRGVSLVRIPAYDSPCVVTERAALDLMK